MMPNGAPNRRGLPDRKSEPRFREHRVMVEAPLLFESISFPDSQDAPLDVESHNSLRCDAAKLPIHFEGRLGCLPVIDRQYCPELVRYHYADCLSSTQSNMPQPGNRFELSGN